MTEAILSKKAAPRVRQRHDLRHERMAATKSEAIRLAQSLLSLSSWMGAVTDNKEPAVTVLASPAMTDLEMQIVQGGLSPDVFYTVAKDADIPVADLASALGMNERTIQRKKKAGGLLDADQSERTFRGLKIWMMAKDTLGGVEQAREWLLGSIRSLGGESPLFLLGTAAGERKVIGVLEAIEYGIYL
jgi:putative toxin-antitoxin system antitoxin component (TIGR02293 family)